MALGPVVAAALTDHSTRRAMLTVAGVDVIKQPNGQGNGYGVPLESIVITEVGPGGTSSIEFDLEDPLGVAPVPRDGDELIHWNISADVPWFGGFVSNWRSSPRPPGGRSIHVTGVGYEVLLDWAVVGSLTIAAGTDGQAAIQACVAAAEGAGPIRAFAGSTVAGTQATPIGTIKGFGGVTTQYALTFSGVTLRDAIRQVGVAVFSQGSADTSTYPILVTVDFYRGLRVWPSISGGAFKAPDDYATLTVTDTTAGPTVAERLDDETDATSIVRAVYVVGANANGTGMVTRGDGRPGRVAVMSDSTIDTSAKRDQAGAAYLANSGVTRRGTFSVSDWTPTASVWAGSQLSLTDAETGATGTARIAGITKRFTGLRETWDVDYGGLRPSLTNLIRRLTRTQLS